MLEAPIFEALRDYFQLCYQAKKRLVAMPSQVVDDAWHEFILFTRDYQHFCQRGPGRFLQHTPAEAMRSPTDAQEGLKRAWRLACRRDGIDPRAPQSLPKPFAAPAAAPTVARTPCSDARPARRGATGRRDQGQRQSPMSGSPRRPQGAVLPGSGCGVPSSSIRAFTVSQASRPLPSSVRRSIHPLLAAA